jgi:hypothetical protein
VKDVIKQILNESKQQYFIDTVVNDMLNKTSIEGYIDKFGIYAPYYNTPMNFIGHDTVEFFSDQFDFFFKQVAVITKIKHYITDTYGITFAYKVNDLIRSIYTDELKNKIIETMYTSSNINESEDKKKKIINAIAGDFFSKYISWDPVERIFYWKYHDGGYQWHDWLIDDLGDAIYDAPSEMNIIDKLFIDTINNVYGVSDKKMVHSIWKGVANRILDKLSEN